MSPADSLYRQIERIILSKSQSDLQKVVELFQLFDRIYADAVKQEKIVFSTLFARVGYVALKFRFDATETLVVQSFRKQALRILELRPARVKPFELQLGVVAMTVSIQRIYGAQPPDSLLEHQPKDLTKKLKPAHISEEVAVMQVLALGPGEKDDTLKVIPDTESGEVRLMAYNLPERNQNFKPSIDIILKVMSFPVLLNLIDVGVTSDGILHPRAIVLEPDYLFDVTAIAECFQQDATEPFNYLVHKFVQSPPTLATHVGNIANYFLDRLLSEAEPAPFAELLLAAFKANPIQLSLLSDAEVRDLAQRCRIHYQTIRQMVATDFRAQGIEPMHCLLEPSFYSARYGLQGRLDVFYQGKEQLAIVELKSGAPFHANSHGLARTHFTQTLLYDLLVASVFERDGKKPAIARYILYSREQERPLRFAPEVPSEQMEALQVRNQILSMEYLLTRITPGQVRVPLLERMANGQVKAKGFALDDFSEFQAHYTSLTVLQRKYFNAFAGFIAREHWLSRAGDTDAERRGGQSALWKKTLSEKENQYAILGYLKQIVNLTDTAERLLVFSKTDRTNPMANFREGDMVLMYPADEQQFSVLSYQIIKGTLIEIGPDQVKVRLRHQQFSKATFEADHLWHLEADSMEIGFTSQYQSLFRLAQVPAERRDLLLGVKPPRQYAEKARVKRPVGMLDDQFEIYREIIAAKDYYLLWGPPGTGKTSIMLRNLAQYWYRNTEETVLFLAFTNRAVDEICETLDGLQQPGEDLYYRIGSEASTHISFRHKLLEHRIKPASTRAEIRAIMQGFRMVVSTVSSVQTNEALFQLCKFDRVVIDEASQLLEPQIIGLLTRVKRALLIGDHKQLPAVCTQAPQLSKVEDPDLQSIGLTDMRNSYFERMYRHATAQGWDWAYGQLYHQGRMHSEIMDFPAERFYAGGLFVLPDSAQQKIALDYTAKSQVLLNRGLPAQLLSRRVLFWPTPHDDETGIWQKTNAIEAARVVELYRFFRALWAEQALEWNEHTFGVITPWRAQIAAIRSVFAEMTEDQLPPEITIDTVERYQGGAREIIVLSLCTHSAQQLDSLVSEGEDGVDRKLNVALTRARKHLIVLGIRDVLSLNAHYAEFIQRYLVE